MPQKLKGLQVTTIHNYIPKNLITWKNRYISKYIQPTKTESRENRKLGHAKNKYRG